MPDQLLPLLALVCGGFLGGFFGAAVGSAGLVSFPILIFLGVPPHAIVATTRPAAIVLELVSAVRFWKEGKLSAQDIRHGLLLGIFGAAGGVIGALFIGTLSDDHLRILFALVIASMSFFLLMNKTWGMTESKAKQHHPVGLAVATLCVGIYGGFFGFTFGTMMGIALTCFGFTLLQSAVLSRTIGVCTAVAAAVVFAMQGTINYPYAIALGIGFGLGAWYGAGESAKRGNSYIKKMLFFVVLASIIKLIADVVRA